MYSYSLQSLGEMLSGANAPRAQAYRDALAQTITPGSVVLEVGTGFGYFALVAAKLGARHVYAVEPNPVVDLGKRLAELNGVADRITFIQGKSLELELPERADIMVSDIRGALPWLADHIESLVDARDRLLKPSAVQIPGRDDVYAALVNVPGHFSQRVGQWATIDPELDLSPLAGRTANEWGKAPIHPDRVLTSPICWATLEYQLLSEPDAEGKLEWQIENAGKAHGMAVWFDTELVPGVGYSNAPGAPQLPIYGQSLFPWPSPVDLESGDHVSVAIKVKRAAAQNRYEYSWETSITRADGVSRAHFAQATFLNRDLAPDPQA